MHIPPVSGTPVRCVDVRCCIRGGAAGHVLVLRAGARELSAEELIPASALDAFDVSVFPGGTGLDEPSFDVQVGEVYYGTEAVE